MDFDRARGSSPAWDRPHSLTGDWGGWRSELEDVQPDIQGIINPGAAGKIDDALVLAMQFGVPF